MYLHNHNIRAIKISIEVESFWSTSNTKANIIYIIIGIKVESFRSTSNTKDNKTTIIIGLVQRVAAQCKA